MQATYRIPRSPVTVVTATVTLLAALLIGGIGGYLIKGMSSPHQVIAASTPASAPRVTPIASRQPIYVQGGRPAIVYQVEQPAPIYVQGGRPAIVYSSTTP